MITFVCVLIWASKVCCVHLLHSTTTVGPAGSHQLTANSGLLHVMNSQSFRTGIYSVSSVKPLLFSKDEFSLVTDFFCFTIPAIFTVRSFSLQKLLTAKADYFCPDQLDLFQSIKSHHCSLILSFSLLAHILSGASTVERHWSIMYTSLNQVLLLLHHASFLRNCKRETVCYRNFSSGVVFHFQDIQIAWQLQIILWNLGWVETSSSSKLFFGNLEVCFDCSYTAVEMLRTLLTFGHHSKYFPLYWSFF